MLRTKEIKIVRHLVACIFTGWVACSLAAFADHNSSSYQQYNMSNPGLFTPHAGATPVFTPPPPAAPAPPPALPASARPDTFLLQSRSPSPIILQTDTMNVRSPLRNAPQGAKNAPPPSADGKANALPIGWDKWDKRYDFRDQSWILFSEAFYTDKYGVIHHNKVGEKVGTTGKLPPEKLSATAAYEAAAEFDDMLSRKQLAQGSFVPTSTTHVSKLSDTSLHLDKGAVLVMSPSRSIKVFTGIGGSSCIALRGKAIAMVSVYDEKLAVVNLTDGCCGAVEVTFPKDSKRGTLAVQSGQVLELYHDAQSPSTNLVATRVLASERLNEHHCCMVCQLNYIRALKKYQLEATLPKKELSRVLKTAAAMVSLGR
jgi:hypothetical protein